MAGVKAPCALIVMGVSGSGKSTVAELLGKRLGWRFEDGDSFHPASNVEKMRAGHPLTDEDRWPWLNAIADEIARVCNKGEHVIIACSALKHTYRDVLLRGRDDVRFVFLKGTQELIADRLAHRKGHFMPPGLLTSQFSTLEPPEASEHVITASIDELVEAIVDGIVRQLKIDGGKSRGSAMTKISLVVSDVDGTLLTKDKTLTERARSAVQRLHQAGIGFTITSSRPAIGMRFLIEPLALWLPVGPFNGSSIVDPEMNPVEQHLIPKSAAERSLQILREFGADIWLFTYDKWLIDNPAGKYVAHEQHTIRSEPTIVTDFTPYLASACKIVGASADAAGLEACEKAMQQALGSEATAVRSQTYYLDITPPGFDKGTFVQAMAKRLGIATDAVATIGDMQNDLAMFRVSGTSIAMGNATDSVKEQATNVTATNEQDGFAEAMEMILKRNGAG